MTISEILIEIRRLAQERQSPPPSGSSEEFARGWYQGQKALLPFMSRIVKHVNEAEEEGRLL